MLEPGSPFPDVTVHAAPGHEVSLVGAAEGSRALFVFYLFDFSST
jgi:peroxiredoxin